MFNVDNKVKLILLGDSSVGKTSILKRYIHDKYYEDIQSTIGTDIEFKKESIDNIKYNLLIWDTTGQEKFRSISKNFYKNSHGILLVFSVDNRDSFNNLKLWLREINDSTHNNPSIIVIGNKSDLIDKREVSFEEAINFFKDIKLDYYESSAKINKTKDNTLEISKIFKLLLKDIIKNDYFKSDDSIINVIVNDNKTRCCF